jgi:5'-nucleotidase
MVWYRSDVVIELVWLQVHPAGEFTLRDLSTIIPMRDPLVVVEASGAVILDMLENAVSKYPSLEGRFPQVTTKYWFRISRRPVVKINGESLSKHDENMLYRPH